MKVNHARLSGTSVAVTAALLLSVTGTARAEGPNLLDKGFYGSLGTFVLHTDTNLRLDGTLSNGTPLPGTPINWERDFGGGDQSRIRFDGYWRFAERHKIRVMYFDSSHSGSKTFNTDINWDGVTYPANTKVDAKMSFSIYELAYEYAFLRHDDLELTGTVGIHYADFKARLAANVTTEGGPSGGTKVENEGSVGAPLPVIGARALWRMSGDFWLDASAQWFALNIDGFNGHLSDYRIGALWQPNKWVGLGVGYNGFKVNVDANKDKFNGTLDWTYRGPQIFYSVKF